MQPRTRGLRTLVAAGLLAVIASLSAGTASAQPAPELTTLKVGVIPISALAPLYLGIAKGFFRDEHLTIEPSAAQGGAAIIPAVLNGDEQIGFTNVVSFMLAISRGLPLRNVIAGAQAIGENGLSTSAVLVAGASPIKTLKDLEGKTIAVNALNNIGDITIKAVMDKGGADSSKVKFVEVGFPEMPSALAQGRVDAIWAEDPFQTIARRAGARVLFKNYDEFDPKLTLANYFTSTDYYNAHRDVMARFTRAMNVSLKYAIAHPAEARQTITDYAKLDPALAAVILLPGWTPEVNMESMELLQASMIKYGILAQPVDLRAAIPR
jgi:NitT/TauT family transport system substrate-binding protein